MEKKQTAVEWLKSQLEQYGSPSSLNVDWETLDELIEQAKEMEKERIINAHLIGPDMDEILDAINFINENYKEDKLKPMDWSLLVSDNYSIFVKFAPEGDENNYIRFMNDLLSENDFKCKLYKTK